MLTDNGARKRFVVGVTGHRHLGRAEREVASALRRRLEEHQRAHAGRLTALSAIAKGADSLFALEAISLGIPLYVVLPFETYADDFADGVERERFDDLLAAAERTHILSFADRSNEAYAAAGRWIVDHSDHLIAVWDGQPARGIGGTGDVVAYARDRGRGLTIITPNENP